MERLSKDQRVKKPQAILALFSICIVGVAFYHFGRSIWVPVYQQFTGRRTVDQVVALYGTAAEQRLAPSSIKRLSHVLPQESLLWG